MNLAAVPGPTTPALTGPAAAAGERGTGLVRVALLGNPNTGKTTLFNRLSGLRHKTANFPGTTQEARIGQVRIESSAVELIDLPGVYSLELAQAESELCRAVLAGQAAPAGHALREPDAVCVVVDATNLSRGLMMVGEALRRRLPTVIALNMMDLARRTGLSINTAEFEAALGCRAIPCCARSGDGVDRLRAALTEARVPNHTPPGSEAALAQWADDLYARVASGNPAQGENLTDRLDRAFTHPVLGVAIFAAVMTAVFWLIFSLANYPMDLIDHVFAWLTAGVKSIVPPGILHDFLSDGVVTGIGATVIFLPQICLLFFTISLLEDTGYLARAAFVMDRVLRPFGLPGHAFVPLLSSHACALPGIMATRAIPDRKQRLATILVAPFMTCSARLPVYVLVTTILFRDRPLLASLAFVGCYALGALAGLFSALIARRTILRGKARPMALELPSYKLPSITNALISTFDRALVFVKNAGTVILAICIVLWWLGSYPKVAPTAEVNELRTQAASIATAEPQKAAELEAAADHAEAAHAKAMSFAGRAGRFAQPIFSPLGYDWQLTVGVLTSFAAREVFVSTLAVIVAGEEDAEAEGVLEQVQNAKRDDGAPVFTPAVCWSVLVFYVLAMQCLPTLAVTAREAGGVKWALLQLAWMSALAYLAAMLVYQSLRAAGIA